MIQSEERSSRNIESVIQEKDVYFIVVYFIHGWELGIVYHCIV